MLIYFSHLCAHVWTGWIFISDNTSHSNNHVNHYLQIHEHYDACYVQNDFGHIIALSIKSRYQLGWSVLYINKTTLKVIHLFFPNTGRVPDGIGGNCKNCNQSWRKIQKAFSSCNWCGWSVTSAKLYCCSFRRHWPFCDQKMNLQIYILSFFMSTKTATPLQLQWWQGILFGTTDLWNLFFFHIINLLYQGVSSMT